MKDATSGQRRSLAARLSCRAVGHVFRFRADGAVMSWSCERGCGAGGHKRYRSADDASRYASAFDVDHRRDLGRDAPPLGLFPLRIAWWMNKRRRQLDESTAGRAPSPGD